VCFGKKNAACLSALDDILVAAAAHNTDEILSVEAFTEDSFLYPQNLWITM
jgi:pantothenate kinase